MTIEKIHLRKPAPRYLALRKQPFVRKTARVVRRLAIATLLVAIFGLPMLYPSDAVIVPGERLHFKKINTDNGLSGSLVNSIVQDSIGFIWFGAFSKGLNRYDGKEVVNYFHDNADSNSIASSRITYLSIDSNGDLWITGLLEGSELGSGFIDKYDYRTNSFIHVLPCDSIMKKIPIFTWMFDDRNGNYYFGSGKKNIIVFSIKNNPSKIELTGPPRERNLEEILIPDNNRYISGTPKRMSFIQGGRIIVEYLIEQNIFDAGKYQSLNSYLKDAGLHIKSLLSDQQGNIWVMTDSRLIKYTPGNDAHEQFSDSIDKNDHKIQPGIKSYFFSTGKRVKTMTEDNKHNLWLTGPLFGQEEVFFMFDPKSETFYQYKTDPFEENHFPLESIIDFFIDRNRSVWIATRNSGILKFNLPLDFHNIQTLADSIDLADGSLKSICEDHDGNIWLGTNTELIYRFKHGGRSADIYKWDNKKYIHAVAYVMFADHQNTIWAGTNNGLWKLDRQKNVFVHIDVDSTKTAPGHMYFLYEDRFDTFWIGTEDGLYSYDRRISKFHRFPIDTKLIGKSLHKFYIRSILEDKSGNFWLGTSNGLFKFDRTNYTFINYSDSTNLKNFITEKNITNLFEDNDGQIWIGSSLIGRVIFNPSTKSFTFLDNKIRLPYFKIIGILQDKHKNIWFKTGSGLYKYNPETNSSTLYDRSDNVNFYYFRGNYSVTDYNSSDNNYSAFCQLSSGWIYACGNNGITYFHPDSLQNIVQSNLVITSFTIEQKEKKIFTTPQEFENIVLPWYDNYFSINFSLLDYYNTDQNTYEYIMEGLDENWITSDNSGHASYANVPPGHYTFRVVGNNAHDIRSKNEAIINIRIIPPFWRRLWFKIAIGLFAFIIVFSTYYIRLSIIQKQKEILEKQVAERTQSLTEKTSALVTVQNQLEQRVQERTRELASTNDDLKREIIIRQKAEESLRRSEETARVLLNAPIDLSMLLDPQGNILALNKSATVHFGKLEEQLIHRNMKELLAPAIANSRHEFFIKSITEKIPQEFEDENKGRIYYNTFYPIIDIDGNVSTIAIFARDITDQKKMEDFLKNARNELEKQVDQRTSELRYINRKLIKEIITRQKAENKLRSSEEKYRDLFQNANDLIWTTDKEGRLLSINNHFKKFSGYTKKELLSLNPVILIRPEHQFRIIRSHQMALKNQPSGTEVEVITKNHEIRAIWLKVRPIVKDNQVIGVHGIGRDVTDLIRAQNELRKSEELKRESLRQFTLKLAHEIKNPLASIKSSAQLVAGTSIVTPPQIEKHMDIINRNVNVCNKVISDLYSYSHLNNYKFEECNTLKFIKSLEAFLNEKMNMFPGVKFSIKYDQNLPAIYIDEFRLSQAFQNIITNALESIVNKGKLDIRVRFRNAEQSITFECKDNGVGIPTEDLPLIFQPFYSSKSKGFGLGLSLAKEIIEYHHGKISVASEVRRGTTFTVELPKV